MNSTDSRMNKIVKKKDKNLISKRSIRDVVTVEKLFTLMTIFLNLLGTA